MTTSDVPHNARIRDHDKLFLAMDEFIARVLSAPNVVAAAAGGDSGFRPLLDMYANEARVGLKLIAPLLYPGIRILEVGSGIGLLARFLHDQGVDVTGIEPSASGFGFMQTISHEILEIPPIIDTQLVIDCTAEKLSPEKFGLFDIIYSTNVLEHIPDLGGAFAGMASVLAPEGAMVHLCPNYVVPYEPHFGIPILPGVPRLTRFFVPGRIARLPGVWDSLNFITSGRVRRIARSHALTVTFDRGVLDQFMRRLDEDPLFRKRQGGMAALIVRVLKMTRIDRLVGALPGEYMTPMIMRLKFADQPIAAERP